MKKRKADQVFEASVFFRADFAKDVQIVPILWRADERPATCEEQNSSHKFKCYHCSFERADLWTAAFPSCLPSDIVNIVLEMLGCYDIVLSRCLAVADLCVVCGLTKQDQKKYPVRCDRCCAFFCNYCWTQSGYVPLSEMRPIYLAKNSLLLDYRYCPACLCGIPLKPIDGAVNKIMYHNQKNAQ